MTEFNLSNYIELGAWGYNVVPVGKVKEFIRLLKDDIDEAQEDYANLDYVDKIHIINIINKRAGDKLLT